MRSHMPPGRPLPLLACLLFIAGSSALAAELVHDTQSEFSPGIFDLTVLGGSEAAPTIGLDTYSTFDWFFDDDAIDGWTYHNTNPNGIVIATEDPPGQIHLSAEATAGEVYAFAYRTDISIPNVFSVEYTVRFDRLQASGVADPFVTQPTAGCARLDVIRSDLGLRVDVFTDRLVAFYREGNTGVDYPTIAYVDLPGGTDLLDGAWHTLRFEVDLSDPGLPAAAYLDGGYLGDLAADTRNGTANPTFRMMAYSREVGAGPAEFHVDRVRVGQQDEAHYATGNYTSPVLDLAPTALNSLAWTALPASVYPWQPWVKDPDNPIIASPCLNENILFDIDDPLAQPIKYEHPDPGIGEVYWMCYATGGIGGTCKLAYCEDENLDTWVDYGVILSPDAGEDYVFSPQIFLDDGTYYLIYDVRLSADGNQRNAYATAPAPTGPWTKGQIILELGAPGEWDDLRVTEPFVFKEGDTYFMFYMGDSAPIGDNEQIGLATTTETLFPLGPEAGGLWTKHGLILPHNPDPTAWDRGLTADPSVIKVGDVFYMRYTGSYANEHWQLGTAWATDPYGPWNRPDAPDITLGAPGAWDDDRLVRGAIHYHDGRYYSPYTGNNGSAYAGGMASADPLGEEGLLSFETATSADGVVWEAWQPVSNGGAIASTPQRYVQYRATFNASVDDLTPVLTSVTLSYEEPSGDEVVLAPIPQASGPINCSTSRAVDFVLTPAPTSPPIRGYTVEVTATPELFFGTGDVTVYDLVPGEGQTAFVTEITPGTVSVDVALNGDSSGLVGEVTAFTVVFQGAASGTGTVSMADLVVRDLDNNDLPALADGAVDILVDCELPGSVTELQGVTGHEQVSLSWQDPGDGDLAGLEVWRAVWHDGSGVSAYPEYDDLPGDVLPPRPADRAAAAASADWTLIDTVAPGAQGYEDAIAPRGIYRYEVFAVDLAANASPRAEAAPTRTNYWLGDFALPYDGEVDIDDIHVLGESFGVDEGHASYNAECDIGPTDDSSARGLPTTDSAVQFEDLIIAAINFGTVASAPAKAAPAPVTLAWRAVEPGVWSLATVDAAPLQGLRLRLDLPAATLREVAAGDGPWFLVRASQEAIDLALVRLGRGPALAPGIELLRVRLTEGAEPDAVEITARDAANRDLTVQLSDQAPALPTAYAVHPASPNPFNPRTEIRFELPEAQAVRLGVYDLSGRLVRWLVRERVPAGRHAAVWDGTAEDGRPVPSGVYFWRVEAGPLRETGKMSLVK